MLPGDAVGRASAGWLLLVAERGGDLGWRTRRQGPRGKILGQEYSTIFINECSQVPDASVVVALTRLAQVIPGLRQRAYYDLNPVGKGHWSNQIFGDKRDPVSRRPLANPDDYARMFLNPIDNAVNLSPEYLSSLENLPARQRKRFYEGVYVDELDGALWTYEVIEVTRVEEFPKERCRRIVVAVDPSGAGSKDDASSDEIGIVVAALGDDGHGYVLADRSVRDSPAVWGVSPSRHIENSGPTRSSPSGTSVVRWCGSSLRPSTPRHQCASSPHRAVRACGPNPSPRFTKRGWFITLGASAFLRISYAHSPRPDIAAVTVRITRTPWCGHSPI